MYAKHDHKEGDVTFLTWAVALGIANLNRAGKKLKVLRLVEDVLLANHMKKTNIARHNEIPKRA
jgi:hypothetical protein